MLELDDKEFDELMFPVNLLQDTDDPFKKFSSLRKYKEFTTDCGIPFVNVIKYIGIMYDAHTPLFTLITNLTRRKIEAAIMAGFVIGKDDKFEKSVDEMLRCINPITNAMILRYCRIQKNVDWSDLVVFEESREKQKLALLSGEGGDDKTKDLIANIEKLGLQIAKLTMVILNRDNNKNLVDFMYDEIEEEQLLIRPELVAQAMKEGRDVIQYFKDGSQ